MRSAIQQTKEGINCLNILNINIKKMTINANNYREEFKYKLKN